MHWCQISSFHSYIPHTSYLSWVPEFILTLATNYNLSPHFSKSIHPLKSSIDINKSALLCTILVQKWPTLLDFHPLPISATHVELSVIKFKKKQNIWSNFYSASVSKQRHRNMTLAQIKVQKNIFFLACFCHKIQHIWLCGQILKDKIVHKCNKYVTLDNLSASKIEIYVLYLRRMCGSSNSTSTSRTTLQNGEAWKRK